MHSFIECMLVSDVLEDTLEFSGLGSGSGSGSAGISNAGFSMPVLSGMLGAFKSCTIRLCFTFGGIDRVYRIYSV